MKKKNQFAVHQLRDKLIYPDDFNGKKYSARYYIIDFGEKENIRKVCDFLMKQLGPFMVGGFGLTPVRHTTKKLIKLMRLEADKYDQDDTN